MESGSVTFTVDDLFGLCELVSEAWLSAADADWSVNAGTVDWSCLHTADHAVDCVYAPAFFLASRRTDRYPQIGLDLTLGDRATPELLVESLGIASHLLAGVVRDAPPDTEAVIFSPPRLLTAGPRDFVPRAALELALHAHDVCLGLGVPFEMDPESARRLVEHTLPWLMWTVIWDPPTLTGDPWGDLLRASGRLNDS